MTVELLELPPLDALELEDRAGARFNQVEQSARFGELLLDEQTGELRSFASLIEPATKAAGELDAELPAYARRARVRELLADKIERDVLPLQVGRWLEEIPERLRSARRTGAFGVQLSSGRPIVFWDVKAGLSRLCPDDAREESMRLTRRVLPTLEQLQREGCRLTSAVFTTPNLPRGELRAGMKDICRRFRDRILRSVVDGKPRFPQIVGALCVLEAPLGRDRDWNVHLNVILITRGFLDWGELRRHWHWNVHLETVGRGGQAIGSALRELIKYAAQATAEKSLDKASSSTSSSTAAPLAGSSAGPQSSSGNRPAAPPMLDWSGAELLEWLQAFKGFRRTRAYGALHGAKRPEATELGQVAWLGSVRLSGGRFRLRLRLLDSIPEDKSPTLEGLAKWRAYCRRVIPPPDAAAELAEAGDAADRQLRGF